MYEIDILSDLRIVVVGCHDHRTLFTQVPAQLDVVTRRNTSVKTELSNV